jgi:hypothetical protein
VELWLADHYQGNGVEDLASVTWFADRDALLDAVAGGEVDVFSATAAGMKEAEYPVLGTTERLYTMAVVVKAELMSEDFAQAFAGVLGDLQQGKYGVFFGAEPYETAVAEALDAQRRIVFLMG